jgi:dTDP-4-amino-4,6-dideoxygalactose transaminase
MTAATIPFNHPFLAPQQKEYVLTALETGKLSGDYQFTKDCHQLLEKLVPGTKAFLTTSCTHALEMSALLLNIKEGDEVIIPSFTFVSTVNAFVMRGATPVFADVRPDTLNIDEKHVAELITPRTKAVVPVHYAGVACEMAALQALAQQHGFAIVEDNAHGLFGKYKGQALGSFGALATQSFHETKNISCGEGGALLINDETLVDRAEILREKGTNRSAFFQGRVDKYTWVDLGSSYLPSDVLAAMLKAQLQAQHTIQNKRKKIWETYESKLESWAEHNQVKLPTVPSDCTQAYHLFYMLLPHANHRADFLNHLKQHGIYGTFHYLPLHLSPMGQRFAGQEGQCPVTEDVSARLVRLPLFVDLSTENQSKITDVVKNYVF